MEQDLEVAETEERSDVPAEVALIDDDREETTEMELDADVPMADEELPSGPSEPVGKSAPVAGTASVTIADDLEGSELILSLIHI